MREAWRDRRVRLLLAGQATSMFGDWTLLLVFGIWGKSLTGSNSIAGLMIFAMAAPGLLGPFGGLLADRVRRIPLMVALTLVSVPIVTSLWLVHDRRQVWLLFAVAAWYGLSGAVFNAAMTSLIPSMLPPRLAGPVNGTLATVKQGLRLLGPLVGAGLFSAAGGGWVATLDAATFALSAAALIALQHHEQRPSHPAGSLLTGLGAGFRHLRSHPALRRVAFASFVAVSGFGLIESAFFAMVGTGLHRPVSFIGVLASVQGVGAILGGVLVTVAIRRVDETRLFTAGLLLATAGVGAAAVPDLTAVLIGTALLGAALPVINVSATTLLQRVTPAAVMGRTAAAFDVASSAPYTVAIAVGAALIGVLSYETVFVVIAGLCASAAIVMAVGHRAPGAARTGSSQFTRER